MAQQFAGLSSLMGPNGGNLQQLQGLYNTFASSTHGNQIVAADEAMRRLIGQNFGQSLLNDVETSYQQNRGAGMNDAIGRGLGNTSILDSNLADASQRRLGDLARAREQIGQFQLGILDNSTFGPNQQARYRAKRDRKAGSRLGYQGALMGLAGQVGGQLLGGMAGNLFNQPAAATGWQGNMAPGVNQSTWLQGTNVGLGGI